MRAWIDIAVLASTKNLNGGLVAKSASGLPLLLSEGMEVALVPPVLDGPRNVVVSEVASRSDTEALVFFDGVDDADVARTIVGCHCLVRRDSIDWDEVVSDDDVPSWEGWIVHDEGYGFVGEVTHIEPRPLQPLLHIVREDGAEVLVPLVEDFISSIDEDARRIVTNCPSGLFDL